MRCTQCQNEILINDSLFCPFCGNRLYKADKKSLIGGVISVVGSCASLAYGTILLTVAWLYIGINNQIRLGIGGPNLQFPSYYIFVGALAIVTAALGLFAGFAALKKIFFRASMVGLSSLLFCGILITIPIESNISWQAGLPIISLATVSIIFTMLSKSEFH